MFKTTIIGIDGQDGGRDATALARALAPDARYTFAHVYPFDETPSRFALQGYGTILRDDSTAMLETERTTADLPGAELATCGDSSVARGLHRLATRVDADLAVIGSSHRSVVGRMFLGDASRAMLHGAPCPVAVAPHGHTCVAPRAIGVGFDGSAEARDALGLAVQLAQDCGARLHVVSVVDIGQTAASGFAPSEFLQDLKIIAQATLDEAIVDLTVPVLSRVAVGSPGEVLEVLATEVDLIVCGSRGYGPIRRVVIGSTAEHLIHHVSCPVLVMPRSAIQVAPAIATTEAARSAEPVVLVDELQVLPAR